MEGMTGLLPGGYWDSDGTLHREFELSVLTGSDEEYLGQIGRAESASLVSTVLSRTVKRVGTVSPVTEDLARQLLVADRQYLLLKLRQCTFGNTVRADVFCPWPECGRRVSMDFKIDDLPVEEFSERAPFYTMTLSENPTADKANDMPRQLSFRLPNGGDQEALSGMLRQNEAKAMSMLLTRVITHLDNSPAHSYSYDDIAAMSSAARAEIEAEMERVSPKVETTLDTVCPECGRTFAVPFDVQRFFFGELRTDVDLLYRQVHYLAYHYHWAEPEIMAMAGTKRQRYIDLLSDEIERLNRGE